MNDHTNNKPQPVPRSLEELYPSPWLRPDDLNGRAVTVTIQSADVELIHSAFEGKEVYAVILNFGRSKRLILNKTQAEQVAEIAKSDIFEEWANVRIQLAPGIAKNRKPTINITRAPVAKPQPTPEETQPEEPQPDIDY